MGRNFKAAESLALLALQTFAKSATNRDCVIEGQSLDVDLVVAGSVGTDRGRSTLNFPVRGRLQTGFSFAANKSEKPDPAAVVAHLLRLIPKTRRRDLVAWFAANACEKKTGRLLEPDAEDTQAAGSLLAALTVTSKQKRSGQITFAELEK